jgi:hypothetical protein
MSTSFSSTIADWQSFYMLAGTASATLVGLLFVAVSLHIDLIGESGAATILSLARRTFTRFIIVVVVALLFLVPHQDPKGLGLPLLAVGLAEAIRTLRVSRQAARGLRTHDGFRDFTDRVVLSLILPLGSSIGFIVIAVTIVGGTTAYLYWMVPIVAVVLTTAATNAWDLMLGLARYRLDRAGKGTKAIAD